MAGSPTVSPATRDPALAADAASWRRGCQALSSRRGRSRTSVMHGVHGRRRAGPGETFWQFRPFMSGEPAARIDWRRSARDDRVYVREREWEAAHTIWIWIDRSASMAFVSELAPGPKIERAVVLGLAARRSLVRGGERVGLIGLTRPLATRGMIERFAEAIALDERFARRGGAAAARLRSRRARKWC